MTASRKPLYQMTEEELTKLINSIDTRGYRAKVSALRRKLKALDRSESAARDRVQAAADALAARVTPLVERAIEKQMGMRRAAWLKIDWQTSPYGQMHQGGHFASAVRACVDKIKRDDHDLLRLKSIAEGRGNAQRETHRKLCDLERPLDHARAALRRAQRENLQKHLASVRGTTAYRKAKDALDNISYVDLGVR